MQEACSYMGVAILSVLRELMHAGGSDETATYA